MISVEFSDLPLIQLPEELKRVLSYWQGIRQDRLAPTWTEFDMMEIPSSLLPMTMVKDVEAEPHVYRYRFYGSGFARLNQRDLTGKTTDDVAVTAFARALRISLDEFVEKREPRFYDVKFVDEHRFETGQRLFRLPLSDDGKTINHIASIVFKHYDIDRYHELIEEEKNSSPRDTDGI